MRCSRVRNQLLPYQDGELSAEERRQVERHLRDCRVCAHEHARLAGVVGLIESLPEVAAPRHLTANVLRALAADERVAPAPAPAPPRFAAGALLGLASLALSALVVGTLIGVVVGGSAAIAPVATAAAKTVSLALEVGSVTAEALTLALAKPLLWLLIADIALLLLVIAGRRRLLEAWRRQSIGGFLAA
jgi:anti-sigma factor RsiW